MKLTKFVHSCVMVEMPEPVNRTVLFDPGEMSAPMLQSHNFQYLDDIVITHEHSDHMHVPTIQALAKQFPEVRVTCAPSAAEKLKEAGVNAGTQAPEGMQLFESPHEGHTPFLMPPEQIGVHYLDAFTHPGDGHSFKETKDILALPITAPWGSTDRAVQLALELQPKYIIPIHDWHWRDEVRRAMYDRLEKLFAERGIAFCKPSDGESFTIQL